MRIFRMRNENVPKQKKQRWHVFDGSSVMLSDLLMKPAENIPMDCRKLTLCHEFESSSPPDFHTIQPCSSASGLFQSSARKNTNNA